MNNDNLSFYEGVRAQSATQQGIHMPDNVAAQTLGQAYANAGDPLDKLSEQFVKSEDFAGKMKAEGDMNAMLMDANTEMVRRFNLPDGDGDSFHNADGSVRQGAIKDFLQGYMRGLNELHKLPTLPESQAEIQRRAMHYGNGVAQQMVNQAMETSRKKQASNLQYLIKTQEAMGDYAGVRDSYDKGWEQGIYSEAEAVYGKTMADKSEAKSAIDTKAANIDLDGLWDDWTSGKYEDDPVLRNYLYEALQRCNKPASTVVTGKDGKKTVKNHCPRGLTEDLKAVYDLYNGDFGSEDAKNAARSSLQDYAYGIIGAEWTPEKEARIKGVFKVFGASDDYASDIITQIKGQVTDPEKFKPKTAMGAIPKWQFLREENWGKTQQYQRDYDTSAYLLAQVENGKKVTDASGKKMDEDTLKARMSEAKTNLERWKRYEQSAFEEADRAIVAAYNEQTIGKNLKYSDQVAIFESCISNYLKSKGQTPDFDKWEAIQGLKAERGAYAKRLKGNRRKQKKKAKQVAMSIKRADEERGGEAPPKTMEIEVNTENGGANGLPENATRPIVYVPKGNPWSGQVVKVRLGKKASNAVVKEADVDKLTLSQRLRSNLMLLDIYTGAARFENGTLTLMGVDDGLVPSGPTSLFPEEDYEEAVPMSENY